MARKISMKQAINEALDQEMTRDPLVIMMGEDIVGGAGGNGEMDAWGGVLGVTKGLYAKHGDRLLDTPLSESAYIGLIEGIEAIQRTVLDVWIERAEQIRQWQLCLRHEPADRRLVAGLGTQRDWSRRCESMLRV